LLRAARAAASASQLHGVCAIAPAACAINIEATRALVTEPIFNSIKSPVFENGYRAILLPRQLQCRSACPSMT
jgi:hypothetical protein